MAWAAHFCVLMGQDAALLHPLAVSAWASMQCEAPTTEQRRGLLCVHDVVCNVRRCGKKQSQLRASTTHMTAWQRHCPRRQSAQSLLIRDDGAIGVLGWSASTGTFLLVLGGYDATSDFVSEMYQEFKVQVCPRTHVASHQDVAPSVRQMLVPALTAASLLRNVGCKNTCDSEYGHLVSSMYPCTAMRTWLHGHA
jgi:hypothetical protein